jgi:hypothetical protein
MWRGTRLYGVPHGILQFFILILYEKVFQNPAIIPTKVWFFSRAIYFSYAWFVYNLHALFVPGPMFIKKIVDFFGISYHYGKLRNVAPQ